MSKSTFSSLQLLDECRQQRRPDDDVEDAIRTLAADLVAFEALEEFPSPEWFARAISLPGDEDEILDRIEIVAQGLRERKKT